ncbi:MAG: hypothetical protein ACFE9S_07400 [Candidatus Hermodarchaeota archaeon]
MYDQQGDVLLKKIDKLPSGVNFKKAKSQKIVLAEGEETGHNHILTSLTQMGFIVYESPDIDYFVVEIEDQAKIVHQEHEEIKQYGDLYLPGLYKISKVKEYDYFEERVRTVLD